MARRILGLAHVEDMESIGDPDRRARCERAALKLARELMLGRTSITSIGAVVQLAETLPRT
jgi:5-methylthioribose kinase